MGRLKLQSGIKAIEEEPEDFDDTNSNRATLACMINTEVGAVLAVMRRNVRWGGRYMSGDDQLEHSLIQSLKVLRKQIFSWQHQWHAINPALYLQPFLDVIRSDETGAPITGVALSSVYKILTLDVIDQNTVNVEAAMHLVVDAVTSCRFEVTDPASEEVVLMKILQVLLACMKSKASAMLSNQHVCTIVNTCFRIVHQAGSKGELLQRLARHTMHELVRCIFLHLADIDNTECALVNRTTTVKQEIGGIDNDYAFGSKQIENGNANSEYDGQNSSANFASNTSLSLAATMVEDGTIGAGSGQEAVSFDLHLMTEPYGVPCMVEIFHFLCSLLNVVEHMGMGPRSNTVAFDEDVPLFALGLINSAIELGGPSIRHHPRLLNLIQDELFHNLMQFGLSMSPLILSMVCSIGPTIAAISVVFDHAEHEDVYQTCIDGFLAVAKISACHHLEDVLDDLVVSLCKFTTLLNPSSVEEPVLAFGDDTKARMATVTVFTIANRYGDYIRTGWRNILDCILRLHKLGLLPARVASDAADESELSADIGHGKPITNSLSAAHMPSMGTPRRSSGLMGRFSQLLSLDTEEPRSQPTEQQLAAHQRTLQTIQKCHIDSIFTESKFLQAESLLQLARALIWAAGRPQKGSSTPEDEDTAVFCLELLIAITLNNRDRIVLLWQGVYEHIANIVQSTVMPCALVEKAVFGLLRICQRLLPYKENLADELLRSLQLVSKLDARVADAYCEQITLEVSRLVKANAAHIRSQMGWRTITSLLSFTARHPEASEAGFDALLFIMLDGAHLLPANYILCTDAARQFAESRVGQAERSVRALDLMAGSVNSLERWACETKETMGEEEVVKMSQDIGEMWLRLVQGLRKVCLDQREEVRNHALLSLQKCLTGVDGIQLAHGLWLQCFDLVIFTVLDDLLEIAQGHSQKDYRNMEGTLTLAVKLLSKVFLQLLPELSQLTTFCKLWLGVLSRMEKYMKVKVRGKKSEKLQETVPELLKNILLVMKTKGVLVQRSALGGDSLWELTWLHVNNIAPSLQAEVFPDQDMGQSQVKLGETAGSLVSDSGHSSETVASEGAGSAG
ncbi:ARF guanine-nucleotide exchange factor GNOM [Carica papaya]|uniref:ARF guanine-nucleotide exchange factor GNOM n=1 Tax=Carica papaya TaxID=3649 RepID=UPI000B8C9B2F|nr:ARF guanine-nucleotide exchange factor GNOM [Carica papaya]